MKVILDTDILSIFAKIDELKLLGQLFGKDNLAITPKIMDEISVPLDYGYSFPTKVISYIGVMPLDEDSLSVFQKFFSIRRDLGKGELEAVALCKIKGYRFATNDILAREFAQEKGITVFSLQSILKSLWKGKLKSKNVVREIIQRMKKADNLEMSKEVEKEIFGEN